MFDKFIGKSILKNASFLLAESKKGIEEYKRIVPELLDSKLRIIYPTFDLEEFKRLSDLIITNRMSDDLRDVKHKIYTRDLFNDD